MSVLLLIYFAVGLFMCSFTAAMLMEDGDLPDVLNLSSWFEHIRHCETLKNLKGSTKIKLGYLSLFFYVAMWLAILSAWGIIFPIIILKTVHASMKEAVGVNQ